MNSRSEVGACQDCIPLIVFPFSGASLPVTPFSFIFSICRLKQISLIQITCRGQSCKFISRFLFLHDGPINRFSLSTSYLQSSPDVDQWLPFLSRKDVKELVLQLGEGECFRAPSFLSGTIADVAVFVQVAGGDGTAGWLLGVVSDLKLSHPPPIATVPLGTGNNLPFAFGWGKKNPGTNRESVLKFLEQVIEGKEMEIDSIDTIRSNALVSKHLEIGRGHARSDRTEHTSASADIIQSKKVKLKVFDKISRSFCSGEDILLLHHLVVSLPNRFTGSVVAAASHSFDTAKNCSENSCLIDIPSAISSPHDPTIDGFVSSTIPPSPVAHHPTINSSMVPFSLAANRQPLPYDLPFPQLQCSEARTIEFIMVGTTKGCFVVAIQPRSNLEFWVHEPLTANDFASPPLLLPPSLLHPFGKMSLQSWNPYIS
ncbi:hypothetical protein L2E82_27720 [Cichorium intybus]|uniref:Uncharacterized protein n=1 Tax=Cichorium intybus TaxID=13427 RepID=A0ACB9CTX1_CICIN|nr:hypothetical protein L2E82_27720 [Cichorium intybus]